MKLAVCLLTFAFLLIGASQARAMEVVIADDQAFVAQRMGDPAKWYRAARQLGANKVRITVYGPAGVKRADRAIRDAVANGFEPQLTLHWTNWHIRPKEDGFSTKKFLRFARDAVQRWPRVRRFSILNEPDLSMHTRKWACKRWDISVPGRDTRMKRGCLAEHAGARYRTLFRWVYAMIKATRKSAQVWAGETSPNQAWGREGFFSHFACLTPTTGSCDGLRADGWAHHPYQMNSNPVNHSPQGVGGCLDHQRELLEAALEGTLRTPKGGRVPLYYTEFGYQTRPNEWQGQISEHKTAHWWPLAMEMAKACGARQMLIYQLVELEYWFHWDTSIVRRDGTPRPAYEALRKWWSR